MIAEKVVVILDAANAAGEAIARRLSEEGASIVLGGYDRAGLDALAKELAWNGGQVLVHQADMTSRHEVSNLIALAVDTFGRLDVMINNPTCLVHLPGSEDGSSPQQALSGMHALGAIHGIAAAFDHMKRRRAGHIVNVAPCSAHDGNEGSCGSEAGRLALSRLFREVRFMAEQFGIRTTLVAPDFQKDGLPGVQADSVARATAFAIDQPDYMDVNEVVFRQILSEIGVIDTV